LTVDGWQSQGDVRYRLRLDLRYAFRYHTGMEKIPNTVLQLIRKFDDHANHYRSPDYHEAQCCVDDERHINDTCTTFGRQAAMRSEPSMR